VTVTFELLIPKSFRAFASWNISANLYQKRLICFRHIAITSLVIKLNK